MVSIELFNGLLTAKVLLMQKDIFSIHPSSKYLIQYIEKLSFGKIDYDKDNYF